MRIASILDNKTNESLECLEILSCNISWFQLETDKPESSLVRSERASWVTARKSIGLISP